MEIKNIPLADLKDFFTYFQIVTAIAGSLCYYKYKDTYLKYFLFLLWYIVINDFTAKYYSRNISVYNVFFYNIFQVVSFTFYTLLFKNAIKSLKNRKTISILLAFYYLCYLINLIFDDETIEVMINTLKAQGESYNDVKFDKAKNTFLIKGISTMIGVADEITDNKWKFITYDKSKRQIAEMLLSDSILNKLGL